MTTSEGGECSRTNTSLAQPHHRFVGFCTTRAKYRQGRRDTAVKVYTVSSESKHLLVQNVPNATDLSAELRSAFQARGVVSVFERLQEYPRERFTDVYRIKFEKLTSARAAKRKLDNMDFYGGQLHVCYAPEYETVADTREKLDFRQRWVLSDLEKSKSESTQPSIDGASGPSKVQTLRFDDIQSIPPSTSLGPAISAASHAPAASEAVSQASWHRFIAAPSPAKNNIRKRRAEAATDLTAATAPKKIAGAKRETEWPRSDIRTFETKNRALRLMPRSVIVRGKSTSISTDKDANKDTITGSAP